MRLLDLWIGVPACGALTLVRRIADLLHLRPAAKLQRIVFVKLAEQGATVLADAALRAATTRVGKKNVFVVLFEQNRFIMDLLDVVSPENVITIRTTGLAPFIWDVIHAVRRMRHEDITAAIDFEFFARISTILCFLSGASLRVGFHSYGGEGPYRGDLMTHRLRYNPFLHASEVFKSMVSALDIDPKSLPTLDFDTVTENDPKPFRPRPDELRCVEELIRRELGDGEKLPRLILLNSNSGDLVPLRRWPRERYVDLARRLLQRYVDICIVFTGSPDEAAEAASLADEVASNRCISLGGKTTLRQLLVLYSLAEVMVTNDSGPGHYAALTPMNVVVLFGPETPIVFGPRTTRSEAFRAGVACSPCLSAFNNRSTACTNNVCMQRIEVEAIFDAVCRAYDQRRDSTGRTLGGTPIAK